MKNNTDYTEIYTQALPYMEANTSSLYNAAIAVFIGFAVFGVWAYFSGKKKSFIPLIIIIVVGTGISGTITYLAKNRAKNSHPYIVNGKIGEVNYDSLTEHWFFTIKGNEALEIYKDGSSQKMKRGTFEFYYWAAEKKGESSNQNPMTPFFYRIYDNLKINQNITLLIIPKEAPLGHVENGKLVQ